MKSNNFCFFDDEVKKLRDSIESDGSNQYGYSYKNGPRDETYAAIGGLIPDVYSGKGNPLDDKKFVEALKDKYKNSEPDPFHAFLKAAKRNLPAKYKDRNGDADEYSGERHLFKNEESQYERNEKESEKIVWENLRRSSTPSDIFGQISKDLNDGGIGKGLMAGVLPGVAAWLFKGFLDIVAIPSSKAVERVGERVGDSISSKNPLLDKLVEKIDHTKTRLISEKPDDRSKIELTHAELKENIDEEFQREVNRYQSLLTRYDKLRIEKNEGEESDLNNPKRISNTVNKVKVGLNNYVEYKLFNRVEEPRKTAFKESLFPNGVNFAEEMLADIRGKNKEKKNTGISGGTDVDLNGVTPPPPACVIPKLPDNIRSF